MFRSRLLIGLFSNFCFGGFGWYGTVWSHCRSPDSKDAHSFLYPSNERKAAHNDVLARIIRKLECRATGLDASISSGLPFVLAPYIPGPPRCCS